MPLAAMDYLISGVERLFLLTKCRPIRFFGGAG
jgi:hypothetical protein